MLIDRMLKFSNAQAITSASAASTYAVDTGIARDIGTGEQLYLIVVLTETMVGAAATVTPSLRTSATATGSGSGATGSLALGGSPATVATGAAFAALSTAGSKVVIPLPPSSSYLRYLDVYFTLAGGTLSAGKFTAMIVKDADLQTFYAAGYTVQ